MAKISRDFSLFGARRERGRGREREKGEKKEEDAQRAPLLFALVDALPVLAGSGPPDNVRLRSDEGEVAEVERGEEVGDGAPDALEEGEDHLGKKELRREKREAR